MSVTAIIDTPTHNQTERRGDCPPVAAASAADFDDESHLEFLAPCLCFGQTSLWGAQIFFFKSGLYCNFLISSFKYVWFDSFGDINIVLYICARHY